MNRVKKTIAGAVGAVAAGGVLVGAVAAGTATATGTVNPDPSADTTCRGPAASLSTEKCSEFKAELAKLRAQRDAVFGQYGLTAPAGRGGGMTGGRVGVRDQVAKLPAEKQAAFKAELVKLKAQRDAVFAKYGLTAPAGRGGGMAGGGGVRDQVAKLPADKQAALKAELVKLKAQRDAVFAKYGLTAPAGRGGA
jgi:hypothetical protein